MRITQAAFITIDCGPLNRAGNFTAAETARTYIDMPGSPVDNRRDALNIRFPHAIAAPVGVTDFDAKGNSLTAILTFCHLPHLLKSVSLQSNAPHDNRTRYIKQVKNSYLQKNLQNRTDLYKLGM